MTKKKEPMAPAANGEALNAANGEAHNTAAEWAAAHAHQALVTECTIVFNALGPATRALFNQLSSITTHWMAHQGFWDCDNFGEKIAMIHSEISEALEAHRKGLNSDHLPGFSGVAEELADAVIRIFALAGRMGIPLGEALIAKSLFNLTREHKHGKAY